MFLIPECVINWTARVDRRSRSKDIDEKKMLKENIKEAQKAQQHHVKEIEDLKKQVINLQKELEKEIHACYGQDDNEKSMQPEEDDEYSNDKSNISALDFNRFEAIVKVHDKEIRRMDKRIGVLSAELGFKN